MKLLHLDIETAPNLAHVWGLWQQNVALNQLIVPGYVLCWAAKWDGEKAVAFRGLHGSSQKKMLEDIHGLLSEADGVVTYNGKSFDIPILNGEFAQSGIKPPPPYKHVDLLTDVVKNRFRFPSFKLEYVAKRLGVGSKVKHEGHLLWIGCMNDDAAAWKRMELYNKGDVLLQERLYHKVRPWISNPPIHGLYNDGRPCCPNCGSENMRRRGMAKTRVQTYQQYQCQACGAWCRDAVKDKAAKVQRVPVL